MIHVRKCIPTKFKPFKRKLHRIRKHYSSQKLNDQTDEGINWGSKKREEIKREQNIKIRDRRRSNRTNTVNVEEPVGTKNISDENVP